MLLAFKMRHLRENLRFPLPSCFSAHYYPPHHSKVTSWQMLLTVCRCPVLKYKLPFSLKSPSHLPTEPIHCPEKSLAPWAQHTSVSSKNLFGSEKGTYCNVSPSQGNSVLVTPKY